MSSTRRRLRPALLGIGAVVLLVALVTAWQAWTVRSALKGAKLDLQSVAQQLEAGNPQAAASAADRAREASGRADFHSHTPVWWVAQYLPVVGDDVTAVRTVSSAAHELSDGVVTPMVEAGFTPDRFRPRKGRIAIEPVQEAGDFLEEAAPRVASVETAMDDLETAGLVGAVKEPVEEMQTILADAARVSRAAAIATELLPGMLGGEGDRTYLLAFQNNAEVRATGGMPGTLGVLTARDGRLAMDRTFKPGRLEDGTPVVDLTDEELLLFEKRMALFARSTNLTPHFPRAAELLSAFWDRSGRPPLDGVLSIDPVALSYLVEYTGPITLDDGRELTSDNTVEVLLRDSYELELGTQDQFFDRAAHTIFDAVVKAKGSAESLVSALAQGIDERRVAVWSAHPDEQRLLTGEDVANELPQDPAQPELGLYVNDASADKLSYYLHSDVEVTSESCSSAGVQKLAVEVRLRSSAPRSGLSPYVAGEGRNGLTPYWMRNSFLLVAPTGGRIDEVTLDGQDAVSSTADLYGRSASSTTVDLAPEQAKTLRYVVYTGSGQDGEIRVLSTPLADGTGGEAFVESGCTREPATRQSRRVKTARRRLRLRLNLQH